MHRVAHGNCSDGVITNNGGSLACEQNKKVMALFWLVAQFMLSYAASVRAVDEGQILLQLKSKWNAGGVLNQWPETSIMEHGGYSYCNWTGISCDPVTHSVLSLDLSNKSIVAAEIPWIITELKALRYLDLSSNNFVGSFPSPLLTCTGLQILNLASNRLSGPLPEEINLLHQLRSLDLSNNIFSGEIPSGFGRLGKMESLHLEGNQLTASSIPASLGNLTALKELALAWNPFLPGTRIPEELGNLHQLKFLWLTNCSLGGQIPKSLANATSLEHLDLAWNQLTGTIPEELTKLQKMSLLYLYGNYLSGSIPGNLSSMGALRKLDLSSNNLEGSLPDGIGELVSLKILFLYWNKLSGPLPASIVNLSNLEALKLFGNMFSGSLPRNMSSWAKLIEFDVSENQFSGPLASSNLCSRKALIGFYAFSNNFTGSLPDFLGKCSSLISIDASDNQLSGEVPSGVWTLPSLFELKLHHNHLQGPIPNQFPPSIGFLDLSRNGFSGHIPSSIGNLPNLYVFQASCNNLSGQIPAEITSLTNITCLSLRGNRLSGNLPSYVTAWKTLAFLDFSDNAIVGHIPEAFSALPVLTYLNLSHNRLSGKIPSHMGLLNLNILDLSYNQLEGPVPALFNNLAYNRSFSENAGLCGKGPLPLPPCAQNPGSGLLKRRIMLIGAALSLMILCACLFIFNICRDRSITKPNSNAEFWDWDLERFCPLDFHELHMMRALTKSNIIGSGASGEVYRVSLGDDKVVAVKRIQDNGKFQQNALASSSSCRKEILSELEIYKKIRHSNIVKLLCCISTPDSVLLVYEFMQNGSLHDRLHDPHGGHGLPWDARLKIAIGAARALSYLHHDCCPAIIHRDVKSSNILLDSELNSYIADLGLARRLHCKLNQKEMVTDVVGSVGYIAPEYAYTRNINEKTDIYSFGVVLLELVSGRKPYGSEFRRDGSIVKWALEAKDIGDVLDSRLLANEEVKDEMMQMLKMGLLCTSVSPSKRPSMRNVMDSLLLSNHREL